MPCFRNAPAEQAAHALVRRGKQEVVEEVQDHVGRLVKKRGQRPNLSAGTLGGGGRRGTPPL